ncbi:phage tail protein I [Vibrio lentus]|uniref:phage tail protein I n=1 Tax=Vibrio lentus TaxID=136468 RepID=UPI000C816CBC|nr:phage tail protein I [Vibrio lentus]PMK93215.1 phage tail protein I [Vibrio lentus]
MSEPIDKDTLLPDNRTTFERSYEEGTKALVKSEDVLPTINDPMTTPSDLLPLMASERGVNDWFFSDTEAEKRAITAVSYSVHQTSGTNAGIIQALDAVDYTSDITHWKQVEGGKPYSVYVTAANKTERSVDRERIVRLIERLNHVKSERDSIDLTLSFSVSQSFRVSAGGAPPVSIQPLTVQAKVAQVRASTSLSVGASSSPHTISIIPIETIARIT